MMEQTEQVDFEKIFQKFGNLSVFYNTEKRIEAHADWPDALGTGFLSMINLRRGFFIGIEKYSLRKKLAVHFTNEFFPFKFHFSITGGEEIITREEQGDICIEDSYAPSTGIVYYSPAKYTTGIIPAGVPIKSVCLYTAPCLLHTLMGEHYFLHDTVYDIARGVFTEPYYTTFTMTPAHDIICRQILNCTYAGEIKRVYLESKAFELLALTLVQLASSTGNPSLLCQADMERTQYACELMKEENTAELNTAHIAQKVGMTHAKLNACFRDIYGVTAFAYLRGIRLKKAKRLLREGNMNVTEVAYEVGYSSLSHFSKAFREIHGSTPSNYLRKVRRR